MNKIHGKHEFKFGYEVRMHRISFLQVSYPEGQWNFQAPAHRKLQPAAPEAIRSLHY